MPYSDMLVHPSVVRKTTDDGSHELFAHYVKRQGNKSAGQIITEAMVYGIPVVALCGKKWIPSRDPKKYPLCPECKELALGGNLTKG